MPTNSTSDRASEIELKLLLPKIMRPPRKSVVDLRNPGVILIIWDLLLGIPFSLLIALLIRAFMRWVGYEANILASRLLMIAVNLFVVWCWRVQLLQLERERRVRAEIRVLDEVIVCLEKVLVGVEAKEVEQRVVTDDSGIEESDDDRQYMEHMQKRKLLPHQE